MYCKKCGEKIKDGAKFCAKCGTPAVEAAVAEPKRPVQIQEKNEQLEKSKSKKLIIALGIVFLVILIVILIVFVLKFRSDSADQPVNDANSDTMQQDTSDESESDIAINTGENTETQSELAYTDNDTVNLSACLTTDAYETIYSEDGTFSFGYPKYIFNRSSLENGVYTLEHNNGIETDYRMRVYKENNSGDPLSNAQSLYRYYNSSLYSNYFERVSESVDSQGMARALVAGYYDSSETDGVYIIAANDGTENYILEFEYYDSNKSDLYKDINYVVDCVYRYCSFSGTTYRPRTFAQFAVDDMGEKK